MKNQNKFNRGEAAALAIALAIAAHPQMILVSVVVSLPNATKSMADPVPSSPDRWRMN